jgi:hypothetical protein
VTRTSVSACFFTPGPFQGHSVVKILVIAHSPTFKTQTALQGICATTPWSAALAPDMGYCHRPCGARAFSCQGFNIFVFAFYIYMFKMSINNNATQHLYKYIPTRPCPTKYLHTSPTSRSLPMRERSNHHANTRARRQGRTLPAYVYHDDIM